jgi:PAS domain S-box-containing protein
MRGSFRRLHRSHPYLATFLVVAASMALRRLLDPVLGIRYPYLLQFVTVLICARYLGFAPAMAGLFFASSPLLFRVGPLSPPPASDEWYWMRIVVIYGLGTLLIWTFDRQRRMSGEVENSTRIAVERLEQLSIEIEQREREQRLSAQLRSIVESSDDAIVSKGLDSVILSWNYGAEQIYGYTASEAIGRPMDSLVPPDRRHEEADMIERIRHGGRVRHFETIRLHKDGAPIHVSLTISPIQDPRGRIVGISHISREITARKQLEEQLRQTQKLESLGVLAGGLAHDFNNLLTGIMGNASLARVEVDERHPARGHLSAVLAASERAALLIRQMLAYAGKGRVAISQMDLSGQVSEIVSLIRTSMAANVLLDLQLAPDLPPVEADRAQLQQVIMNLAINGAEAIGTEAGTLRISTYARETESERQVVLEVSDTGCGMDDSTRARIFDPFYTTKFTGRGLGLSAVIGIIRAHHGFISVESSLGQGTTFTVVLPEAVGDRGGDVRGYGHLLVAGDEELVRDMTRFTLERRGYTVETVAGAAGALEAISARNKHFDAILLDLNESLPEQTIERLQAIRPGLPVVLCSALTDSEANTRFGAYGIAAFVQKPYTAAVLARKVKQALRRSVAATP